METIPDNDASKNIAETTDNTKTKNASEVVNEQIASAITQCNRDGNKLVFPENIPVEIQVAATAEIRRRDTQSAYSKEHKTAQEALAHNKILQKQLDANIAVTLTPAEVARLEELKITDPDAWRAEINTLEGAKKAAKTEELAVERTQAVKKSTEQMEIESRDAILKKFLAENPGTELNDDIIKNDVPPRINNLLINGQVTFHEYLVKVTEYLNAGKAIHTGSKTLNQTNLSNVGGSDIPGVSDESQDIPNYENASY